MKKKKVKSRERKKPTFKSKEQDIYSINQQMEIYANFKNPIKKKNLFAKSFLTRIQCLY